MRIDISYPPGTGEAEIRSDLATLSWAGELDVGPWRLNTAPDGVVAEFYVRPREQGKSSIAVWPFILALRRFDEIVVAYLGAARPGKGAGENGFVRVEWESTPTGITYRVRVKRRDFAGMSELVAGILTPVKSAGTDKRASQSQAATVAIVVLLALTAGAVTYWGAQRLLLASAGREKARKEVV
ncbi:MAG: hypothetical protein H5T86_11160 [Armatimonadetes bacterium]|nr:hypothetical protein [Armatimonadota bacterium]